MLADIQLRSSQSFLYPGPFGTDEYVQFIGIMAGGDSALRKVSSCIINCNGVANKKIV